SEDVSGAEPVVRRDRERERSIDARDLLDADRVARDVHPGAAVLLRNADPEETHLGEPRHDLLGKALFFVPGPSLGTDFGFGKLANVRSKDLMMLGEAEIHARRSL